MIPLQAHRILTDTPRQYKIRDNFLTNLYPIRAILTAFHAFHAGMLHFLDNTFTMQCTFKDFWLSSTAARHFTQDGSTVLAFAAAWFCLRPRHVFGPSWIVSDSAARAKNSLFDVLNLKRLIARWASVCCHGGGGMAGQTSKTGGSIVTVAGDNWHSSSMSLQSA